MFILLARMKRSIFAWAIISLVSSSLFISGCEKEEQQYQSITVTDRDGNIYHTVKIGSQIWLKENLKTEIGLNIEDPWDWCASSSGNCNDPGMGAWVYYENDSVYDNAYGKLYNYWAIGTANNICPVGFHVPEMSEWQELIESLGGEIDQYGRDTIAGDKLKEEGDEHWGDENTGTNESGFSALPGGYRAGYEFGGMGNSGHWWVYSKPDLWGYYIPRNINIGGYNKKMISFGYFPDWIEGYSIRCIKD